MLLYHKSTRWLLDFRDMSAVVTLLFRVREATLVHSESNEGVRRAVLQSKKASRDSMFRILTFWMSSSFVQTFVIVTFCALSLRHAT
jgi:hypothetical protein